MIRTLLTLLLILTATSAWGAGPYLTCDPQDGVTSYRIVTPSGAEITDAVNGAAMVDLSTWPTGETQAEISAGAPWTLDGMLTEVIEWSDPRPFALGRPAELQSPMNIGLKD